MKLPTNRHFDCYKSCQERTHGCSEQCARLYTAPASPAPAKESATQVPVSASLGDDDEVANGNRPDRSASSLRRSLIDTTSVSADPEQPSAALADDATRSAAWLRKLASGYDPVGPEYENAARLLDQFAASLRSVEPAPRGEQQVTELRLCESQHLTLRPDQLYRFTVADGFAECARIAREGKAT